MNHQFDELARGLAQSVTRRAALKKFGLGFAAIAIASLGLASATQCEAGQCKEGDKKCHRDYECCSGRCLWDTGKAVGLCDAVR